MQDARRAVPVRADEQRGAGLEGELDLVRRVHFDGALDAQAPVFERHARRLLRLQATLASADQGTVTCFVYKAVKKGPCGSFMNCPHTGRPLDETVVEDLVDCCASISDKFPEANFRVLYLHADPPPDDAPSHPRLLTLDAAALTDDEAGGLLQFLVWQAAVLFDLDGGRARDAAPSSAR